MCNFVWTQYIFELEQLHRYYVSSLELNERGTARHQTRAVVIPSQMC